MNRVKATNLVAIGAIAAVALAASQCQSREDEVMQAIAGYRTENIVGCKIVYTGVDNRAWDYSITNKDYINKIVGILQKSYEVDRDAMPSKYGVRTYYLTFYTPKVRLERLMVLETSQGYGRIQSNNASLIRNDSLLSALDRMTGN